MVFYNTVDESGRLLDDVYWADELDIDNLMNDFKTDYIAEEEIQLKNTYRVSQ